MLRGSLVLIAAWCVCGAAAAQEKRIVPITGGKGRMMALVVGNKDYPAHPLTNPLNDADDMKKSLEDIGFQVEVLKNANREDFGTKIDSFTQSLQEGDVVFFYYSGHGIAVQNQNFLIPVDFNGTTEASVRYRAVAADEIERAIEDRKPRLSILVLDACRDNPFLRSKGIAGGGLAPMREAKGTLIAFAAGPGEAAIDNAGERNSLYTKFLLKALAQPGLSVRDLFDRVAEQVHDASGEKILPSVNQTLIGDLVFRPVDPKAEEGNQRFEAIRNTRDPALLEEFLRDFPNHPHAPEAAKILNQLNLSIAKAGQQKADDDLWSSVRNSNESAVVDLYLKQFPSGAHLAEATGLRRRIAERQNDAERKQNAQAFQSKDETAWEMAVRTNSKSGFEAYLLSFAKGAHAAEASAMIAKIPAPASTPAPVVIVQADRKQPYRSPRDKSDYVWIPGGTFEAGCQESGACGPEEPRPHTVTLSDFWIGQTEVTVKAFRLFIDANKLKMPPPSDDNHKWEFTDHPMIKASWQEAKDYCAWVGGRLPSGDEWERAARGGAGTPYPWGAEIRPGEAKYIKSSSKTGAVTAPVKSFDPNGYGLFDVAGNVWEWTTDTGTKGFHQTRGGSWYSGAKDLHVTSVRTFKSDDGSNEIGFRCLLPQPPLN